MLCENCHKKKATVFFCEVNGKEKKQRHICEDCARSKAKYIDKPSFTYSIKDLFGHFLQMMTEKNKDKEVKLECPNCKLNYHKFREQGRFGCANDYDVFAEYVEKIFDHIHNAHRHKGKIPKHYQQLARHNNQLQQLKQRLEEAILIENYEEAASLRDKIKELEYYNET